MEATMEVRLHRDAHHQDMLLEIRLRLEDEDMDVRLTETVADLLNAGWSLDKAILSLRSALKA
jgi:hypothetical protein